MGGIALALAAAAFWTAANVTIQDASRRFGSFGALVWAQLVAIPVVAVAALAVEGPPGALDGAALLAVAGAGAAACVAYAGLFGALGRGQLAVVAPLVAMWSVVSVAIDVVALGRPITATQLAGVIAVAAGNATLARAVLRDEGEGRDATPPLAIGLAVLSALGFGALVPAVDEAGAAVGRLWALPAVWGADLLIGLPFVLGLKLVKARPRGAADWLRAGRVTVFEGSGFVCMSLALGLAPVAVVSPLASLATGLSVLYGVVVLRERVSPLALLGAGAASAGVVLVSL